MEFFDILETWYTGDICNMPDIIYNEDDPTNPAVLEKYELEYRYGFDLINEEESHWGFRYWRRYAPDWMRYDMDPTSKKEWSIIRKVKDWIDTRDHYERHVKTLELAMYEGHSVIVIEPKRLAEYACYFTRFTENTHWYALSYGIAAIWFALFHPTRWYLYSYCFYTSIFNAYAHSRYARTDRFYRYKLWEHEDLYDDVEDELETEEVGEQEDGTEQPDLHWVLKRDGRVKNLIFYFRNQCSAVISGLWVAFRMWQWEEEAVGPTLRQITLENLLPPGTTCDYILPAFLHYESAYGPMIPSDIFKLKLYKSYGITTDEIFFMGLFAFYVWDLFTAWLPRNRRLPPEEWREVIPHDPPFFEPLG